MMPEKLSSTTTSPKRTRPRASGSFETVVNGVVYKLELSCKRHVVKGKLMMNGEAFELYGRETHKRDGFYGFLLEPLQPYPIALLRAYWLAQYLVLKVDFPDLTGRPQLSQVKPLSFKRKVN
jgi:hypothetical protein